MKTEYQHNYSKLNKSVLDKKLRKKKAKKVVSVIVDFLKKKGEKMDNLVCLDIGGSAGFVAKELSPKVKKVFVVDIDKNAIEFGKKNNTAKNIKYITGDGMNLSQKNKSIDVLIINQVYEHVPYFNKLLCEMERVLKDDGICFFGAGNRIVFIEPHYHLPFLSLMPRYLADRYLRLTKRGESFYESRLAYHTLLKKFKNFEVHNYTIELLKHPSKYSNTDMVRRNSPITFLPPIFFKLVMPIIPTFYFILTKKNK